MKHKEFHQFIWVEKGPKNSAIADFLSHRIYHVDNISLELFKNGRFASIPAFIELAERANMLIEVDEDEWIPRLTFASNINEEEKLQLRLYLEDEDLLQEAKTRLAYFNIIDIHIVGEPDAKRAHCMNRSSVTGTFEPPDEASYARNMKFNSCWGQQLAVTNDGKVRPCIFSHIIIADLRRQPLSSYYKQIYKYWRLTKDSVSRCRLCEFRYFCFDCREIARRSGRGLYSTNPTCRYNPRLGNWAY